MTIISGEVGNINLQSKNTHNLRGVKVPILLQL